MIERYELERHEEWMKWVQEIPKFKLNKDWELQVIPPFAGAIARFVITKDKARVSIYLYCYDKLGYVGHPYWEIYPYDDDVFRCSMNDVETLLDAIEYSINQQILDDIPRST